MSDKLGQENAFPFEQNDQIGNHWENHFGMSKRFYAACAAMQGILSYSGCGMMIPPNAAKLSFEFADALLLEELK